MPGVYARAVNRTGDGIALILVSSLGHPETKALQPTPYPARSARRSCLPSHRVKEAVGNASIIATSSAASMRYNPTPSTIQA